MTQKKSWTFFVTALFFITLLTAIPLPDEFDLVQEVSAIPDITGTTTWSGTVNVDTNVTVTSTGILTIQAGTVVNINGNTTITVQGEIQATGATFQHNVASGSLGWEAIEFQFSATGRISGCTFSGGYVHLRMLNTNAQIEVDGNTFTSNVENTDAQNSYGGIHIYSEGTAPIIHNNTIGGTIKSGFIIREVWTGPSVKVWDNVFQQVSADSAAVAGVNVNADLANNDITAIDDGAAGFVFTGDTGVNWVNSTNDVLVTNVVAFQTGHPGGIYNIKNMNASGTASGSLIRIAGALMFNMSYSHIWQSEWADVFITGATTNFGRLRFDNNTFEDANRNNFWMCHSDQSVCPGAQPTPEVKYLIELDNNTLRNATQDNLRVTAGAVLLLKNNQFLLAGENPAEINGSSVYSEGNFYTAQNANYHALDITSWQTSATGPHRGAYFISKDDNFTGHQAINMTDVQGEIYGGTFNAVDPDAVWMHSSPRHYQYYIPDDIQSRIETGGVPLTGPPATGNRLLIVDSSLTMADVYVRNQLNADESKVVVGYHTRTQVLDQDSNPVAGAMVDVINSTGDAVGTYTTDAQGYTEWFLTEPIYFYDDDSGTWNHDLTDSENLHTRYNHNFSTSVWNYGNGYNNTTIDANWMTATVTLTNVLPQMTFQTVDVADTHLDTSINWTGNVVDPDGDVTAVEYSIDGGAYTTTDSLPTGEWWFNYSLTNETEGPMTIVLRSSDAWGDSNTLTRTIFVNNNVPTVQITSPQGGGIYGLGDPITISGVTSDQVVDEDVHWLEVTIPYFPGQTVPATGTRVCDPGASCSSFTFPTNVLGIDGTQRFDAIYYDGVHTVRDTLEVQVVGNNQPPTGSIDTPLNESVASGASLLISGAAVDIGGSVTAIEIKMWRTDGTFGDPTGQNSLSWWDQSGTSEWRNLDLVGTVNGLSTETATWEYDIDTRDFPNGDYIIDLLVRDGTFNYYVSNGGDAQHPIHLTIFNTGGPGNSAPQFLGQNFSADFPTNQSTGDREVFVEIDGPDPGWTWDMKQYFNDDDPGDTMTISAQFDPYFEVGPSLSNGVVSWYPSNPELGLNVTGLRFTATDSAGLSVTTLWPITLVAVNHVAPEEPTPNGTDDGGDETETGGAGANFLVIGGGGLVALILIAVVLFFVLGKKGDGEETGWVQQEDPYADQGASDWYMQATQDEPAAGGGQQEGWEGGHYQDAQDGSGWGGFDQNFVDDGSQGGGEQGYDQNQGW